MGNEACKEESSLSRTIGPHKDAQHVHNHEIKKENDVNNEIKVTVTPTRDPRKNKQTCETLLAEQAQKSAHVEDSTMLNLKK